MNPDYTNQTINTPDGCFHYWAYALLLRSNMAIKELIPTLPPFASADVEFKLGSLPPGDWSNSQSKLRYDSACTSESGEPDLRIWELANGEFLRLAYWDGVEFWFDRQGKTVWAQWPDTVSSDNALNYLVGPVLGLLLRLRGQICLHASAVVVNDWCAAFVGSEGVGKSTTAAGFARLGFPVLSDDITAVVEHEHTFHVVPAYPRVNLWPEAVRLLFGSGDALPPIAVDWDKRFLALGQPGGPKFADSAQPIGVIYIFGDLEDASEECIVPMSAKAALMMLVANTYATNFLNSQQRAEEFAVLSRLVSAVTIRQINPRRQLLRLEELCDVIRRDFDDVCRRPNGPGKIHG